MEELTSRERAILRLIRIRLRRFVRGNWKIFWAALAVAGAAFWFGMERNFYCPDLELGEVGEDLYWVECACERDGSRWRYGICEGDPVEWSAADSIALVVLRGGGEEGGAPPLEIEIRDVFRGGLRKGDSIVLPGADARRLRGEIARHPHGSVDEPLIVMLHTWVAGVERWQFLEGGYYPFRAAANGQPAMVFLRPRDIQIFSSESGRTYLEPPAMVPIKDFMFSLWLARPKRWPEPVP